MLLGGPIAVASGCTKPLTVLDITADEDGKVLNWMGDVG